jgi:hypothetical protein
MDASADSNESNHSGSGKLSLYSLSIEDALLATAKMDWARSPRKIVEPAIAGGALVLLIPPNCPSETPKGRPWPLSGK